MILLNFLHHNIGRTLIQLTLFLTLLAGPATAGADPESVIRRMVQANADLDMETLSRLIAHDADITSYTIGGRKYVGWPDLERDMREEFQAVTKLEIPIRELKVWTKGDLAWFTMELDYIRHTRNGSHDAVTVLPLRESGVLENREGEWLLLSWHESFRSNPATSQPTAQLQPHHLVSTGTVTMLTDLSGEWEVLEVEDDKRYKATLDKSGNGPYTQHGGRFTTTKLTDRLWQGTWHQPGNDREGGFELLLSEDGTQAKGVWWYTRVGSHKNIPPKEHGGSYHWKRLTPIPTAP
ncbi:MAG: nuclear transport factor 2 family protein [Nitrospira sp.]